MQALVRRNNDGEEVRNVVYMILYGLPRHSIALSILRRGYISRHFSECMVLSQTHHLS